MKSFLHWLLQTYLRIKSLSGKEHSQTRIYIFRHDELGDFILWLGAAKVLREYYSTEQYHITLIVKPSNRQLAELCPYWDEIWDFDQELYLSSRRYRFKMILKLMQADIVINPVLNHYLLIDNLIGYSDAREITGINVKSNEICYHSSRELAVGYLNYTRLVELDLNKHIIDINFDFAAALTGINKTPRPDELSFIPEQKINFADYFMVIPGAGSSARCWPPENFAAIIDAVLTQRQNLKALICGTSKEFELGEKVKSSSGQKDRIINYCGKSNLVELCGLVKNAKFILCNECGPLHVAACFKVPVLSITGGGHFGLFHPYPDKLGLKSIAVFVLRECFNCNWCCYRHPEEKAPYPCIGQIKVTDAQSAVDELLKTIQ